MQRKTNEMKFTVGLSLALRLKVFARKAVV